MEKKQNNFGAVYIDENVNIVADVYRVTKRQKDCVTFSTAFFAMNGIEFNVSSIPETFTVEHLNAICAHQIGVFHLN